MRDETKRDSQPRDCPTPIPLYGWGWANAREDQQALIEDPLNPKLKSARPNARSSSYGATDPDQEAEESRALALSEVDVRTTVDPF